MFSLCYDGGLSDDIAELEDACERIDSTCSLQPGLVGSTDELYKIMLTLFCSVGCPTWESSFDLDFVGFTFGLDRGPDNQGFGRRIVEHVDDLDNVTTTTIWCFLHGTHLSVKEELKVRS